VKIYVAAVEALRKKERQDETEFTTQIDGFLSLIPPPLNAHVLFCSFFLKFHPIYDQTQGYGALRITLFNTCHIFLMFFLWSSLKNPYG